MEPPIWAWQGDSSPRLEHGFGVKLISNLSEVIPSSRGQCLLELRQTPRSAASAAGFKYGERKEEAAQVKQICEP